MKYGYNFMDWGLYEIDELLEVRDLEGDYIIKDAFGEHVFSKEDWCWVKAKDPIFLIPHIVDGHYDYTYTNEGPYYKKHIFDSKIAAENYGRKHSNYTFM